MTLLAAAAVAVAMQSAAAEETTVRLGWCTPSIDVSAGAPIAAAMEFGWFAAKGVKLDIVPVAGSTDCVLNVTTGQMDTAYAAPEAVAIMASRGGNVQYFYTGFNRNMFGVAVPETSDIDSYEDLRGKRIGVLSMSSVGVVIARSVAQSVGLDPDNDISIVVSGSAGQSRALLENGEVDAISHWDMIYETISSAGLEMRKLPNPAMDDFPSNGFVALKSTIEEKPEILAAVARGYAMGSIFTRDNPQEAAELHFKHFPQSRSTGLSLEEDIERGMPTLHAVINLWRLPEGRDQWGYNDPEQYQAYIDWLEDRDVLETSISAEQIINNSLIGAINDFDEEQASRPN
jgi:NitT/TauT family transport system substrate-binding protein